MLTQMPPPLTAQRAARGGFFGAKDGAEAVSAQKNAANEIVRSVFGAGDEARTRYLHLGKVALYRMSYTRISNAGIIIAEDPKKSSIFFNIYGSI